jgi:hypothetical protein
MRGTRISIIPGVVCASVALNKYMPRHAESDPLELVRIIPMPNARCPAALAGAPSCALLKRETGS